MVRAQITPDAEARLCDCHVGRRDPGAPRKSPLYFLVVGAAQARRFSAALGIAAIMLSGACGFLIAHSEISPWTTVVELSIYSGTLFSSLMALRVADFYARSRR